MMRIVVVILVIAGMGLMPLSVLGRVTNEAVTPLPPPLPLGQDQARPGATLEHGWAIANIGPCAFQDFYKKAWDILGEPVSSFDSIKQSFEYAQLICQPDSPAGQQVVLANLGYTELRSTGKLPDPNAPLDPAVQDFLLLSLQRGGIEPAQYFGEPISPPACDQHGQCTQYLEKTLLTFPQGATTGEAVSRAPLGLWQSHPEDRPEYLRAKAQVAQRNAVRWPFLIGGVAAFVLAVLVVLVQVGRRRFGSLATV